MATKVQGSAAPAVAALAKATAAAPAAPAAKTATANVGRLARAKAWCGDTACATWNHKFTAAMGSIGKGLLGVVAYAPYALTAVGLVAIASRVYHNRVAAQHQAKNGKALKEEATQAGTVWGLPGRVHNSWNLAETRANFTTTQVVVWTALSFVAASLTTALLHRFVPTAAPITADWAKAPLFRTIAAVTPNA